MRKIFIFSFSILLFPLQSFAAEVALPHYLNFDGQLLDNSNIAITTATSVEFDIYDPSGTCLLYNETQSITPDGKGEFSTQIGPRLGSTSSANDGNLSWNIIFKNDGQLRGVVATYCPSGYTPAANDGRKLRVTVSGTPLTPDYTLAPVPMATVAETLQGKRASDFILANPATNISTHNGHFQLNNQSSLNLGNATNPSTNFVSIQAPATFTSYILTLPADDGAAGQILTTDGSGVLSWTTPAGGGAITSVFGRTGTVAAAANDYSAAQITNIPGGNIIATDLQSAINELDSKKLSATANGTLIPNRPSDPASPSSGQIWYDTTANSLKYYDGTTIQTLGNVASGDPTKLPLAGGTMTGAIVMGSNDITATGHIMQSAQRTLGFGGYTSGQEGTLIGTLSAGHEGTTWYNTSTDKLMYWDGAASQAVLTTSSANSLVPNCSANQNLQMSVGPVYVWSCVDHTFADGTTALPGITFSADLDTGIFHPANDVIAISTIGTERMRIDSTGNIGIGTISPISLLDVNGAITSRSYGAATGQTGQISFFELAANGPNLVKIRAPDSIATNYSLTLPSTSGTAGHVLQTDGTGILSWVSAGAALMMDSLDFTELSDTLTLDASTDIAASGTNVLSITNSGTGYSLVVNDQAADTSPFVIDPTGRVGIGTASPTHPFDVLKTISGGSTIDIVAKFSNDSSNTITTGFGTGIQLAAKTATIPAQPLASIESFWTNPGDATRTSTLQFSNVNNGTMAPKMVITGSGSVGIGTPTPQATLDISGFMKLAPQASAPMTCPGNVGLVAYNGTANLLCVCNGTNWRMMDGTSACGAW